MRSALTLFLVILNLAVFSPATFGQFPQPNFQPNQGPFQQPNFVPNQGPFQQPNFQPNQNPFQQPNFQPNQNPFQQPNFQPNQNPFQQPNFQPNPFPQPNPNPLPQPGIQRSVLGRWRVTGNGLDLTMTFLQNNTVNVVHNNDGTSGVAQYSYDPNSNIMITNFRGERATQRISWVNNNRFLCRHLSGRHAGQTFVFTRQ